MSVLRWGGGGDGQGCPSYFMGGLVDDGHGGASAEGDVGASGNEVECGGVACGDGGTDALFGVISAVDPFDGDGVIVGCGAAGDGSESVGDGVVVAEFEGLCGGSPDGEFGCGGGAADDSESGGLSGDV